MSIYATLWSIKIRDPARPISEPRWVEVWAQAVPPHIGSPTPGSGYEDGDLYGSFLPPPVETDQDGQAAHHRAVVFVVSFSEKGTARSGQEYVNPLLVLSGEEYAKMPFPVLLDKLHETIRSGPRVIAEFSAPDGSTHIVTEDDL